MKKIWFWGTVLDSLTLSLVAVWLTERFVDDRIGFMGGAVALKKSYNDGIAWGIELGSLQNLLILAALVVVTHLAFKAQRKLSQVGFGFIVGGGLSNIIDRLHDGLVTDVFQVGSFPIFNLADAFITIGVGLLFVDMWRENAKK